MSFVAAWLLAGWLGVILLVATLEDFLRVPPEEDDSKAKRDFRRACSGLVLALEHARSRIVIALMFGFALLSFAMIFAVKVRWERRH